MANLLSSGYKQYLAASWLTDNIKLVLLSVGYVYSSAHANLSDIAAGTVATSPNLAGKTNTSGLLKASNVTFTALVGATVTQMWLYKDTGVAGTSTLMIYFDSALGIPAVLTGIDETVEWSTAGIAQL